MPDIPQLDYYWRPGCPFCMRLERDLNRLDVPLTKHNIWENPGDAAAVRAIANGSETVPTVVIGSVSLVNPTADQVLTALQTEAPELVPDGWEPKGPSKIGAAVNRLLGG